MAHTVSVVIGSYNRLGHLRLAIDSVREELSSNGIDGLIVVVDGGSTDGSLRWLTRQKDLVTIVQHNRGTWRGSSLPRRSWGYFMNLGFRCANSRYVCMLSDDCLVVPGAVAHGIRTMEETAARGTKVGAAAFYWRNWPEERDYKVCTTLGDRLFVNHGLYLRAALEEVSYIDESFHFYHADGDLCLRMWDRGYQCVVSEDSYVEHFHHANLRIRRANKQQRGQDWSRYLERWGDRLLSNGETVGGIISKTFDDPSRTCDRLRRTFNYQVTYRLLRIRKALGPWLRRRMGSSRKPAQSPLEDAEEAGREGSRAGSSQ